MSADLDIVDQAITDLVDRNLDLAFAFGQAIIADPTLLDDIPNGVTLVLLPEDAAALTRANVEIGLHRLRAGRDVYVRHVRLADLPAPPPLSDAARAFLSSLDAEP